MNAKFEGWEFVLMVNDNVVNAISRKGYTKDGQAVKPKQILIGLMVGSRRCGKTTLMYSMVRELQTMDQASLAIEPADDASAAAFSGWETDIVKFSKAPHINVGIRPSFALETYEFFLYDKKNPGSDVFLFKFIDVPGEWIREHEHDDDMNALIAAADVLYLTVNAPSVAEDGGVHKDMFVTNDEIMQLSEKLNANKGNSKLLLLVPLMAEKYYWNQFAHKKPSLSDMTKATKTLYAQLIATVKPSDSIALAVTPVLTIGGVVFSRFDANNDMYFSWVDGGIIKTEHFSPRFCEQPMLYTLRFFGERLYRRGKSGRLIKFFRDAKQQGISNAWYYAFNDPMYNCLTRITACANFTGFTANDFLLTEDAGNAQKQRKYPVGLYLNLDFLGMELIHDPQNVFCSIQPMDSVTQPDSNR